MWRKKPFLYEINTWVWLNTLSRRYGQTITLHNVPDEVLDTLAEFGFDALWLMGIWQRSPAARSTALRYKDEWRAALPDLTDEEVLGSAYAIYDYQVAPQLGGREGLTALRERMTARGLRLILDFVPNHVAVDHPWISNHPEFFVQGIPRDLRKHKDSFFTAQDTWGRTLIVAHGRDPYFPPWIDTAQLNAFSAMYRRETVRTLLEIASQCDGVRCDMAMLMLNNVFEQTWGDYVEEVPQTEYWMETISAVKAKYPQFLFMAEVYWGLEQTLQQQGFDFTYDKTLYDHLAGGTIDKLYEHLSTTAPIQPRVVHFIENHDERRAAEVFENSRAAATLICTLPGLTLLHDGQLEGYRVKLPVQIARQPDEAVDEALRAFYRELLKETNTPIYQEGTWTLFEVEQEALRLLAYGWRTDHDYRLIVVNLTDDMAQGTVILSVWDHLAEQTWHFESVLGEGKSLVKLSLQVELEPYSAVIYHLTP